MRNTTKIPKNRPSTRNIPEARVFDTLADEINYKYALIDINKAIKDVRKEVFNY